MAETFGQGTPDKMWLRQCATKLAGPDRSKPAPFLCTITAAGKPAKERLRQA